MDLSSGLTILLLRIGIVVVLYLFLFSLMVVIQRELRAESSLREAAHPRAHLVVLSPGSSALQFGDMFELEPVMRLGRSAENDIVIDDSFASASHAIVALREGRWWVGDAGSTNGTLLNGRLIEREAPLRNGDELQVGQVKLRLVA